MDLMSLVKVITGGGRVRADLRGKGEAHVVASPEKVFQLVSDVTRMGEWSPECRRCEWLDGITAPALGARFKGHNRRGWFKWTTTSTVTEFEAERVFAFEVVPLGRRVQTRWRYELQLINSGTLLSESFEVLWFLRVVVSPNPPMDRDGRREDSGRG